MSQDSPFFIMQENGWIKLHRSFLNWEWYNDIYTQSVFITLLLLANHETKSWKGIIVERGSLITSRSKLAKMLNISEKNVRTALHHLKTTSEVAIKTTNKYTYISINKYNEYQQSGQLEGQQVASKGPASGHKQECKNVKNNIFINKYMSKFNELFGSEYQITNGRTQKLGLRLKKFSLEDILKALENLSRNKFYRGENERNWKADPDFLIRNDEQIDRWLNNKPKYKLPPVVF